MTMFLMTLMWIGFGALSGWYASQKGRDPLIWFCLGILLGILSLAILFFLPAVEPTTEFPEPSPDKPMVELIPAPPKILYPEQKEWFYLDKHKQQVGPVGINVLRQEWNNGAIDDETYVWCENLEKWFKIKELADLESSLVQA